MAILLSFFCVLLFMFFLLCEKLLIFKIKLNPLFSFNIYNTRNNNNTLQVSSPKNILTNNAYVSYTYITTEINIYIKYTKYYFCKKKFKSQVTKSYILNSIEKLV